MQMQLRVDRKRLSDRVVRILELARTSAIVRRSPEIGLVHVFEGLLKQGIEAGGTHAGVAVTALRQCGHDPERILALLNERLPAAPPEQTVAAPGLSGEVHRLFESAKQIAISLRNRYIGSEHLLLALCGQTKGIVSTVLAEAQIAKAALEQVIISCFALALDASQPRGLMELSAAALSIFRRSGLTAAQIERLISLGETHREAAQALFEWTTNDRFLEPYSERDATDRLAAVLAGVLPRVDTEWGLEAQVPPPKVNRALSRLAALQVSALLDQPV